MKPIRAAFAAALLALPALAPGCGRPTPPERVLDEAGARQVLTQALDAWKAGRPHASPSESDPTLKVADEDWLSGAKLVDYRVLPGDRVVGPALSCQVALQIQEAAGRKAERQVTYLVSTDPTPSVIRQD